MLLAVLVGSTTACFEIEGRHVLYLSPDGAVTWTVLEEEIRIDADSGEGRTEKEEEFLDRVVTGEHVAAVSLGALYPSSVHGRILRDETPQAILTEARYPGIDRVYQNLFDLYGVAASTELTVEEDRTRLRIAFWPQDYEEDEEDDGSSDDEPGRSHSDEILLALILDCRIVLTEGRFLEGRGFEILDGGTAARPAELDTDEAEDENRPVTLSLTWTNGDILDDEPGERDGGS
jgi:hypothetical protein